MCFGFFFKTPRKTEKVIELEPFDMEIEEDEVQKQFNLTFND